MSGYHATHFLKVSGAIAGNKGKEFEQTIRFVFNQLPPECTERTLSMDIHHEGHYYFFSQWLNERALKKFLNSVDYQLISGAFDALGNMEESVFGTLGSVIDLQNK
jgi:quinol monooxygenase YgiN